MSDILLSAIGTVLGISWIAAGVYLSVMLRKEWLDATPKSDDQD